MWHVSLLDDEKEESPRERNEDAESELSVVVVVDWGVSLGQFSSTISRIFSWSSKLRSVLHRSGIETESIMKYETVKYTFFYKRQVYKRLSLDFRQKLRTN